MSTALKPCPFCRSPNIVVRGRSTYTRGGPYVHLGFEVVCVGCQAHHPMLIAKTEPAAIAAWNRRDPWLAFDRPTGGTKGDGA
jgi:Lar family restriction alleviation protein